MYLKIQPSERDRLKLSWRDGDDDLQHYFIREQFLSDRAREAHTCLSEMAAEGHHGAAIAPERVRQLALAGSEIWWALFDAACDGDGNRIPAARLQALKLWIENKWARGQHALAIATDPTLHAPWALVYPRDRALIPALPQNISLADTLDHYPHFWGLRYELTATFTAMDPLTLSHPDDRARFRMLSFVHDAAFEVGMQALGADEQAELTRLINIPVGKQASISTASAHARDLSTKQLMLHFFGHNYSGRLDGGNDEFGITDFRRLLSSLSSDDPVDARPQRLVFVNACSGLVGSGYENLRTAVAEQGYCGLVSTEADVPTAFAARFGLRLLKALASSGVGIAEAMRRVRHDTDLWPLSFLYGCYADRSYRVPAEDVCRVAA